MIIATAGHVDHGKTTLLQAITGINADRLPEEKQRGMTIDLGYAYWPQPDGSSLGFIDVPGHEKFLANMLAGMGGIDHALLVVACDDGVMAQTHEHLTILRLSGRPKLTVALTKADRADEQQIAQVRQQVLAELVQQGWVAEQVSLFVTAANSGTGIDELRTHLAQLNRQQSDAQRIQRRFRLAIDRAFSLKGSGLVVTGTVLAGQVAVGETLWLTGSDCPVRVRGIHAQNQSATQAQAGQRIALNITGDTSKQQISRGDWLLAQRPPETQDRVLVEVTTDTPMHHWQSLHLHQGASHITGRVSMLNGTETPMLAELLLDTPLYLAENDRFILRDIGAKQTLGGARVIALTSPKRGKRQPAFLAWLTALAQASSDIEIFNLHLTKGPLSIQQFAWARQLSDKQVSELLADSHHLVAGDSVLSTEMAESVSQSLRQVLSGYHQQHSDQLGLGRARLRRMALPTLDEGLVYRVIDELLACGQLTHTRGWLHLPEHRLAFTPEEEKEWLRARGYFGSDPWWVRDLAVAIEMDEEQMRGLLRKAARLGHITAIVADRYYLNDLIYQFADLIRTLDTEKGSASAADFRDHLGIGRKLAIQILEFFDRSGFTRRLGNDHILRDRGMFS
ncbi:selenocysteine-specific translation elongation factor [Yersinia ruckeri]|uniref:Selenocysteine-specific elongation factor n=1 Tax=Yersinia ruckeri TaxID=29486 RepID=A0A085U8N1_YERRU|nr:selenocysteine-specific translation elongation factor [Yersinia ruckeri]ARY99425.1 selenocysteinyl-tRNA-specific translation factor [Yersinia ruckeri]AUQ41610.1 selenocysteinyl-tRNA-specific translation elongation factor SelB [Yersinia ruckeri]EKN4182735.1 selenocysteine-specific translation elongation factor [Yersinia ruckeri]EKN4198085.1 selenocysteine-specific translation elongation factor [Yersinia ruckeri]EKN4204896.1 selenocysteine-specific translation elongation factor [Yersinia ruck